MNKTFNFLRIKVLPSIINLYVKTLRIQIHDVPDFNHCSVFIFWHSRMLMGWLLFKDKSFVALISKSKDGEILNNLLKKWNYKIVRGSSSKGGKEALQEIISLVNEDNTVVLTPDGPRGPANIIKNGALIISNKCGVPIIPIKINYYNKIFLKSWDKFQIPLPFSKCDVYFGDKYYYESFLNETELEIFKDKLSEHMT